ncbi:MAG TPA: universal stress protein [Candidatus Krumholzibacteria bacterium]|nr:universal stress protein [Candidatus Krumholzibacteria bacterium]
MLNFNVIIVTTDLSDYSLRALPYAIGLAERFDAELKVVSVNEPALQATDVAWISPMMATTDDERSVEIKNGLDKLIADQFPAGLRAEARVLYGNPVDAIVEYANETNADLIVSCTHGRGGLSHVLMGSTAEALVRRSPCPVLTLKQPMPVAAMKKGA